MNRIKPIKRLEYAQITARIFGVESCPNFGSLSKPELAALGGMIAQNANDASYSEFFAAKGVLLPASAPASARVNEGSATHLAALIASVLTSP